MINAKLPAICVFCGASKGNSPEFIEAAKCKSPKRLLYSASQLVRTITDEKLTLPSALGRALAHDNRRLIYGGGNSGLMGLVAVSCREAGGQITGIMPRAIAEGGGEGDRTCESVAPDQPDTVLVLSMHERKMMMAEMADGGFVGLPGGLGTFEEVRELVFGLKDKDTELFNHR